MAIHHEPGADIFRRCARAAGLITQGQPMPESLEAFALMVALECAEIAETADALQKGIGDHIRAAFFDGSSD